MVGRIGRIGLGVALALALAACSSAAGEQVSEIDDAVSCDLGSGGALAGACSRAASPTAITAGAVSAASPPAIVADTRAYGVHLVAGSGGYTGALTFTPAASTTFDLYLSSPNLGFRVLAPGGSEMQAGCSSAITSSECSSLRKVTTYTLVAGTSYRLEIGPTTASYVRVYVQTRATPPATCSAGELTEIAAACSDAAQGETVADAQSFGSNSFPDTELDTVYLFRLPATGSNSYGGTFVFTPPSDGNYEVLFGTPNIPVQITDFFAHTPVAVTCTRTISATECASFRRDDLIAMSSAVSYRFDLGPSAGTKYVRVTIRRANDTPPRVHLGAPTFVAADASPGLLGHGDLDGDGHVDLVAPVADDADGITEIELYRNGGSGGFAVADKVSWVAGQCVVADVSGDGLPDVIGTSYDGQGPLDGAYLASRGDFTYAATAWGHERNYLPFIGGGDFDEDGVIDVVAPFDDPAGTGSSGFVITELPSFTVAQTQAAFGASTRQAIAGDFNCDGHQDVVVSSATEVQLFVGNGTGTVAASAITTVAGAELWALDVDGDGCTDVVSVGTTTRVLRGTPSGLGAADALATTLELASGAAVGDFDHDGRLDLAIGGADTTTTGAIAVFFGTPTGFTTATLIHVPDTAWADGLTSADLDGDGFADLAASVQGGVDVFLSSR